MLIFTVVRPSPLRKLAQRTLSKSICFYLNMFCSKPNKKKIYQVVGLVANFSTALVVRVRFERKKNKQTRQTKKRRFLNVDFKGKLIFLVRNFGETLFSSSIFLSLLFFQSEPSWVHINDLRSIASCYKTETTPFSNGYI